MKYHEMSNCIFLIITGCHARSYSYCEYDSPFKKEVIGARHPRALSKDNPRHEVNLSPLLLGDGARKSEDIALVAKVK